MTLDDKPNYVHTPQCAQVSLRGPFSNGLGSRMAIGKDDDVSTKVCTNVILVISNVIWRNDETRRPCLAPIGRSGGISRVVAKIAAQAPI